jgi:tetratricopeptide (TPR) repeat protein
MLANAVEHHQHRRLAEAERIYRQILALDPRHADSLHLLGVLAHQVGRNDAAVDLIGAAIGLDKRRAAYHSNLGTALQAQGKLEEAADSYRRALALKPDLAEAQMNLGASFEAQGNRELAEAHFRRALALRPDLAEVHVNLGNILQAQGKLDEAVASQERALALKPEFAEAWISHANALQAQGRLNDAVASYRRALALKPGSAEVQANLGNALLAQNMLEDAEACYAQALTLKPEFAEAWYNLGNLRQAQNELDQPGNPGEGKLNKLLEAVSCYRRALQLKPQLPEAHYNLGNTLHALERLDEAAASFEQALALRPEYAEAHYNLGCVFEDLDRLDEALRSMALALKIKPDYPQASFGQALAQLRSGDFATGWRNYESRWQSPDHDTPWRAYPQSLWTGGKLDSGRLLLWGEQGVGDEIQFAGLIPEAIRTGNRIILDCDARLKPLFARSFPEIDVVSGFGPVKAQKLGAPFILSEAPWSQKPPLSLPKGTCFSSFAEGAGNHEPQPASVYREEERIAAHLPTGSLPGLLRRAEAAFAATQSPYLLADPEERERFRARYSDGRRLIGLAWHTKNQKTGRKRSIDLKNLAPLFALAGIRWISLQYGDFDTLEEQAAAAKAPLLIDRSVDQFADMDRFAAQVAAMDQVMTIDNSTAHLAGALGLPVWVLLPFAADWRWLENRPDSPWYPALRHFRQPKAGDWQSVLESVGNALAATLNCP